MVKRIHNYVGNEHISTCACSKLKGLGPAGHIHVICSPRNVWSMRFILGLLKTTLQTLPTPYSLNISYTSCMQLVSLCEFSETGASEVLRQTCNSYDGYISSLNFTCQPGEPGRLVWIPDGNTLDVVCYRPHHRYHCYCHYCSYNHYCSYHCCCPSHNYYPYCCYCFFHHIYSYRDSNNCWSCKQYHSSCNWQMLILRVLVSSSHLYGTVSLYWWLGITNL